MGPPEFDGLAAQLYESVLEPERWVDTLRSLAQLGGGRAAWLTRADLSIPTNTVAESAGQPAEAVDAYHQHYVRMDPMLRLGPLLRPGHWLSDWQVLDKEYGRSVYYNEFMRPHSNHAVLTLPLALDGPDTAFLTVMRSERQGAFDGVPPALAQITPHLQRAVRLHFATQDLRARAEFATATLHRVGTPVMVCEPDARVLLANRAAEQLCRASRLIGISDHRLVSTFQDPPLQQAIRDAAASGAARPAWLRLAATAGEEALLLVVTPLAAGSPLGSAWRRPLAVVMASRGAPAVTTRVHTILRELFGLTAAEARVAASIADGHTPAEIATRFKITTLTVRGQMKSVYAKMGVRRQAELSRLLTKLHAILPRHAEAE